MTAIKRISPLNWVFISAIGFLLSVGFLLSILLLPGFGRLFLNVGGILYYVILIPFALISSGFLFGALRSYARATGKNINGTIELGGPVVVFVLVMWGGIYFQEQIKTADTFFCQIYFFADGPDGELLRDGSVNIILEGSTLGTQMIKDGYIIVNLPESSRNKAVRFLPAIPGFSEKAVTGSVPEGTNSIEVRITPMTYSTKVRGYISDRSSRLVQDGYVIDWGGIRDTVSSGLYELELPFPGQSSQLLKIFYDNEVIYSVNQVIPSNGQHDIQLN
jgi:hypothetical protein